MSSSTLAMAMSSQQTRNSGSAYGLLPSVAQKAVARLSRWLNGRATARLNGRVVGHQHQCPSIVAWLRPPSKAARAQACGLRRHAEAFANLRIGQPCFWHRSGVGRSGVCPVEVLEGMDRRARPNAARSVQRAIIGETAKAHSGRRSTGKGASTVDKLPALLWGGVVASVGLDIGSIIWTAHS